MSYFSIIPALVALGLLSIVSPAKAAKRAQTLRKRWTLTEVPVAPVRPSEVTTEPSRGISDREIVLPFDDTPDFVRPYVRYGEKPGGGFLSMREAAEVAAMANRARRAEPPTHLLDVDLLGRVLDGLNRL